MISEFTGNHDKTQLHVSLQNHLLIDALFGFDLIAAFNLSGRSVHLQVRHPELELSAGIVRTAGAMEAATTQHCYSMSES